MTHGFNVDGYEVRFTEWQSIVDGDCVEAQLLVDGNEVFRAAKIKGKPSEETARKTIELYDLLCEFNEQAEKQ